MRVIAGKSKGHKLSAPRGLVTRPTSDRIKESLFNIIQDRIDDSIVMDFFSGSGSLGIEALSRNAQEAYFIDNNKNSIKAIKQNLKKTGLEENSKILHMEVFDAIKKLELNNIKADIIFMDPPYFKDYTKSVLEQLALSNLLRRDEGIVIVEHDKNNPVPDKIRNLERYRVKDYGNTRITFYHKYINGGDISGHSDLSRKF